MCRREWWAIIVLPLRESPHIGLFGDKFVDKRVVVGQLVQLKPKHF